MESVLELERALERARTELRRMRRRADQLERRMLDEIDRVKRSFRAEIVPYGAYEPQARPQPRSTRIRVRRGAAGPADQSKSA